MNMWVSAERSTSPTKARAIRDRLMNPPVAKPKPAAIVEPKTTRVVFAYRCQKPKDAHYRAWQWHRANEANKIEAYIKRRSGELGVSVEDLKSQKRSPLVVNARQLVMYELRKEFGLSYPEIGRKFGGRDHSTALHAYNKISEVIAQGRQEEAKRPGFPPAQMEIIRLRAEGKSNREVEEILGITRDVRKGRMQRAMQATGSGSMSFLIELAKRNGWLG